MNTSANDDTSCSAGTMAAAVGPMDFRLVQVTAIILYLSRTVSFADECIAKDSCTCATSTRTVNLHSIASTTNAPRFKDLTVGSSKYSYNPCSDFTEKGCSNVAVCQVQGSLYYSLGSQSSVKMTGDPEKDTLEFVYSSPAPESRIARVKILCDCQTEGELSFMEEQPIKTYRFTLKTNLACGSCPTGLSVGSVLVILLFVFFIAYWIGGILFLRFVRKAQGAEMVPNHGFWTDFPFLVRDGVLFVFRGCKAESTYEKI